jgi:hypothetical protein
VSTDVSDQHITSIFRVKEISSTSHLFACWFLVELISSTLKMEVICSSETSVDTQRTTRHYIPEDDAFLSVSINDRGTSCIACALLFCFELLVITEKVFVAILYFY